MDIKAMSYLFFHHLVDDTHAKIDSVIWQKSRLFFQLVSFLGHGVEKWLSLSLMCLLLNLSVK